MVNYCPIDKNTTVLCPNNCIGVDPSGIVAGGTALIAASTTSALLANIVPILGISELTVVGGGAVAMVTCQGPLYCRVGLKCCLVV